MWERKLHYNEGYFTKICGFTGYKDLFIAVDAEGGHSDDELDIKISATINEDANNESWGIRDFFIYYTACAKSCNECSGPKLTDCTKCQDNWAV